MTATVRITKQIHIFTFILTSLQTDSFGIQKSAWIVYLRHLLHFCKVEEMRLRKHQEAKKQSLMVFNCEKTAAGALQRV